MSKLQWDQDSERLYETGVSHGVLYPKTGLNGAYANGVAWNGLTSVSENPSGGEPNPIYADNIKYLNLRSVEEFGGTIEAYTYPDEFAVCDGTATLAPGVYASQQTRKPFGFCYRTLIGNDEQGTDYGYKLHIVYGAETNPSQRQYQTVNESPEAMTFSWDFTTTPIPMENYKPIACITIDSTKANETKLTTLEGKLYGTDNSDAYLPLPDEVISTLS